MGIDIKKIDDKQFKFNALPTATRKAFLYCANNFSWLKKEWYLAGGTALALFGGHRQSVDLDFFIKQDNFSELALERKLFVSRHWQTTYRERGTLYGVLLNAKLSFIAYPFFESKCSLFRYGNINILSASDIAVMKVVAISQRGCKRDFVDLFWYCTNNESLDSVLKRVVRQYEGQKNNMHHILKSLVYFADAEDEPMPKLFFSVSWKQIKLFFRKEVAKVTKIYF